jgi:hypothetical protein
MRGLEANEKMDVIRHATRALRHAIQTTNGTSEILVQARPPFRRDEGFPVLRGEDKVVEERGVRGCHVRGVLAPLPGCGWWGIDVPVVSLRSTTGYRLGCLWHLEMSVVSLRSTTGYRLGCLWHREIQVEKSFGGVFLFHGCESFTHAFQ